MFKSATMRLTGWYLLILMLISVTFSIIIYQIASSEVSNRLEHFQTGLQQSPFQYDFSIQGQTDIRGVEQQLANNNLSLGLVYLNLFVLISGGFLSYYLARRSIMPIEKAHEAQSRFTSDASHELRTPLAAMKAEIEVVMKDKNADSDSLKEVLSSNLEEVNKLTSLSEMLLNLSRLDNTKVKLEPVNLDKVVHEIIRDFDYNTNRIELKKPQKPLIVRGNEAALYDLIKILVDNALQYSPADSKISIVISKQDDDAEFRISNSGDGINPEKLPHIFERFYRADTSRTGGKTRGYGLGLALAKKIVELHNGRLFAESLPGEQTTFSFLIPLNKHSQAKNHK